MARWRRRYRGYSYYKWKKYGGRLKEGALPVLYHLLESLVLHSIFMFILIWFILSALKISL
jgi:hypothetical protein